MAKLNTELFIAKRIFANNTNKKRLSTSVITIAMVGIALGLAIMLLSVAIVTGFKSEIRQKVVGFGSHIQLVNFDSNSSYETSPVSQNQPWLDQLHELPGITHIQQFATKPGIIKTDEEIQGIVLKGVGSDYDWSFFKSHLVEGHVFKIQDTIRTNEVIISRLLADQLKIMLNDPLFMNFLNENSTVPRRRKFNVVGIYDSNLSELDKLFVLADIKHVRKLNNWETDQISGFEVFIDNFNNLDRMVQRIRPLTLSYSQKELPVFRTQSIASKYPQIFDWLNLLDMNVWVILALIITVAGFNMISGLLIIILERTTLIGILKALGSPNWSIRKVFLYLATMLVGKGMFWGNAIGLGICFLQHHFKIIPLDPSSYYVDTVPIHLTLFNFIGLNLGTLSITFCMLIIPSWIIARIHPDKAIRFD